MRTIYKLDQAGVQQPEVQPVQHEQHEVQPQMADYCGMHNNTHCSVTNNDGQQCRKLCKLKFGHKHGHDCCSRPHDFG